MAEAQRIRMVLEAEAEAESIRIKGEAEAYVIEVKAKAEAEQMLKKALAMKDYKEVAMIEMVLDCLQKVKNTVTLLDIDYFKSIVAVIRVFFFFFNDRLQPK